MEYLRDLVKEEVVGEQVCLHGLARVAAEVEVVHLYSGQGEEVVVEGINQVLAQEQ